MDAMQLIQNLAPAPLFVTLLALPWLAVATMHAMSAKMRVALDDKWSLRAMAAMRWNAAAAGPVAMALFRLPARRTNPAVGIAQPDRQAA
jgi:hypothetical protein